MMTPDALAQAGAGFGIVAGAIYTGWQSRKARQQAERAADNSHPISNGWGTALREDMAETRRLIGQVHESQTLAERRELQRDQRLERIDTTLLAHLNEHRSARA